MEERGFFDLDARLSALRQRRQGEDPRVTEAFQSRLEVGWIYHDNALEGVVLSQREIKAAIDEKLSITGSEGAIYEGIREHKAAIDFVRELGRAQSQKSPRRGLVTVQLLKQMHELLTPQDRSKGSPYRNGSPPHRAYHHEIAGADKIPQRMRKLCEALDEVPDSMHALQRAAGIHFEFMAIYPWLLNNGKVARLLMNLLLLRDGYPPAVIPGIERQRYYESLYYENGRLADLIADALNTYCTSANQFFDELAELRKPPPL